MSAQIEKENRSEQRGGHEEETAEWERSDLLKLLLDWFFVAAGVDPFRIYKKHDKRILLSQSSEPLMGPERLDGLRETVRRLNQLLTLPIACHLIVSGSVHMLREISLKDTDTKYGHRNNANSTLRWLEQAKRILGDPLTRSPQLTSLVSLAFPIATLSLLVVRPMRFRSSPFDTSACRFLMKPKLEISMVDKLIRQQLSSIRTSFQGFNLALTGENYQQRKIQTMMNSLRDHENIRRLEMQYQMVREGHLDERFIRELRPSSYSIDGYRRLSNFCKRLIITLVLIGISIGFTAFIVLLQTAAADSSRMDASDVVDRWSLSYLIGVLDWRQILTLTEMTAMIALASAGVNIIIGGLLFQTFQHLDWIAVTGRELSCLHIHLRDRMPFCYDDNNLDAPDTQADLRLLKAIVHISIFNHLSRRSTNVQTLMISELSAIALLCLTLTLSSRILLNIEIQIPVVAFIMIYANSVLLMAAAMPSHEITIKKTVWSILAEQARVSKHKRGFRSGSQDPLIELWRKRVLDDEFISNQHPVRALGIGLTFSRVLQANFLLLSIVSWLQTID